MEPTKAELSELLFGMSPDTEVTSMEPDYNSDSTPMRDLAAQTNAAAEAQNLKAQLRNCTMMCELLGQKCRTFEQKILSQDTRIRQLENQIGRAGGM